MQSAQDSEFIHAVSPLFRQRIKYRCLSVVSFIFLVATYDTVFFIVTSVVSILLVSRLINVSLALEEKVWQRFESKLHAVVEPPSLIHQNPAPLGGVIGSLGDRRYVSVVVAGRYGKYDIRLLKQYSTFNAATKKGSFERAYRVLEITTRQDFYHVYIDSKSNNRRLSSKAMNIASISIDENPKLEVEGDVNKYFTIYVPKGDNFHSLITLTPEKLIALRDYGAGFDIEFVDNKIYLISEDKIKTLKDVLQYQESIFNILETIGEDVVRKRSDVSNVLIVQTPRTFVF